MRWSAHRAGWSSTNESSSIAAPVAPGARSTGAGTIVGAAHRDATLMLSGVDFLRLATGYLNPVLGVLKGSLKVKGDRTKALAFSSALDLPVAS